jgi:hypothetical protein
MSRELVARCRPRRTAAARWASNGWYRPARVLLRRSSRHTVDAERPIEAAMARTASPVWRGQRSRSVQPRRETVRRSPGWSRGLGVGTNRTVPSLRRTVWPLRQLWPVERLTPTSLRAAARVQPCAKSFRNCCRLADCGRRPGPLRTRRDDATPTSTDLACVASTTGNHPGRTAQHSTGADTRS